MDHHRRVDAVERAFARDHLLAAETLLRGRAEITHAAGQTTPKFRQRERRAQSRRRDDVVAAGMTHARQRIVFGEDRNRRTFAEFGNISRLEAERFALHRQIMVLARSRQPRRRLEFLQRKLRLLMNRMRQREQLRLQGLDDARDVFLQQFQ